MVETHIEPAAGSSANVQRGNPMFQRFRAWRESAAPQASYQLMSRFWTAAGRAQAEEVVEWQRRAVKSFEPSLTGIAWTAHRLYLVIATRTADYEHVARLIHCRILVRDDPDYATHHGKRISALVLCDDAPRSVIDFARRYRITVTTIGPQIGPRVSGERVASSLDK
jgi:hypothetical protein